MIRTVTLLFTIVQVVGLIVMHAPHAFAFTPSSSLPSISTTSSTTLQMAPGGWGIGTPLDFKDEEYSSPKKRRRRRKDSTSSSSPSSSSSSSIDNAEVAYNAETADKILKLNQIEDAQQFTRRVQNERNNLQLSKQRDLLAIAKFAGLGDRLDKVNIRNRSMNSESAGGGGIIGEEDGEGGLSGKFDLDDDEDDVLDVRVQWDD